MPGLSPSFIAGNVSTKFEKQITLVICYFAVNLFEYNAQHFAANKMPTKSLVHVMHECALYLNKYEYNAQRFVPKTPMKSLVCVRFK